MLCLSNTVARTTPKHLICCVSQILYPEEYQSSYSHVVLVKYCCKNNSKAVTGVVLVKYCLQNHIKTRSYQIPIGVMNLVALHMGYQFLAKVSHVPFSLFHHGVLI